MKTIKLLFICLALATIVRADSFYSGGIPLGGSAPPSGAAGGDLAGTYPDPTIAANAVALGTDTTGGYAASVSEAGPATTATALAANPTNCTAGNYPLGVDASGNAETCTAASIPVVSRIVTPFGNAHGAQLGTATLSGTNDLDCYDFTAPKNITITGAAFRVITGLAANTCGVAIYEDADAGARLITSGAEDCASNNIVQTTTGLSVPLVGATTYRVCGCVSSVTITMSGIAAGSAGGALANGLTANTGTAANSCVAGAPPTTTGAITGTTTVPLVGVVLSAE